MASSTHDRKFSETILEYLRNDGMLDKSVEWIRDNLNPEDVFRISDLRNWANEQRIGDVFSEGDLREWAKNNGFVEEGEI